MTACPFIILTSLDVDRPILQLTFIMILQDLIEFGTCAESSAQQRKVHKELAIKINVHIGLDSTLLSYRHYFCM